MLFFQFSDESNSTPVQKKKSAEVISLISDSEDEDTQSPPSTKKFAGNNSNPIQKSQSSTLASSTSDSPELMVIDID